MPKKIAVLLAFAALILTACGGTAREGAAYPVAASGEAAYPVAASGGSLDLQEPWARPAKSGANSAVYFVIDNGGEADALLDAQCDAAMMVQVHMTQTDAQGNSSMVQQQSVPVPAGQKVSFEPGGLHVMLMNLKGDLEPGQKLPVTLTFEKAGAVQIEATVREP